MGNADGATGNVNSKRNLSRLIVHQHHISSLDGSITSQGTHGYSYICPLQYGRIVDAITYISQSPACRLLFQQLFYMNQLIGRHQFGFIFIETQLTGYAIAHLLTVACKHHCLDDTLTAQLGYGLGTALFYTVAYHNRRTLISLYQHLAMSQRSGLIEHHYAHLGKGIHITASLDENTCAGGSANAAEESERHTDNQGTRTGYHKEDKRTVEP